MYSFTSPGGTCARTEKEEGVARIGTEPEIATSQAHGAPLPAAPLENGRWTGYWHLVVAGFKTLKREPEIIFWVFVFPVFMAGGLGIATRNRPPDASRVAVVSGPDAQRALELLKPSAQKGLVRAELLTPQDAWNKFRLGKYDVVVTPQVNGSFEYRYDPARSESLLARAAVEDAMQAAAGRRDLLRTSAHISSEPGARYIDFLIPGLLGMNLMASGLWGIGFALVEMRQRKLLKRYAATPMRRGDFLLSLASGRLVLTLLQLAALLGFGVVAFRMRILGSWMSIFLVSTIGAFAFGAMGLLTACRAQKAESVGGLINVIMMPMWILSGVFFSYEHFPAVMQPLIKALPLTAFNDALRAIVLEGASLAAQQSRLLILCLWGGVSYLLAVRWFRWT
jgi:ABC-type multidrug transport system permease subunit